VVPSPIPPPRAWGLLPTPLGRLPNHNNLVAPLERRNRGVVEAAQSLVTHDGNHPFSFYLTRRTADLLLCHRPLPHLEAFIAGQQILNDRAEVGADSGEPEEPADCFRGCHDSVCPGLTEQ